MLYIKTFWGLNNPIYLLFRLPALCLRLHIADMVAHVAEPAGVTRDCVLG